MNITQIVSACKWKRLMLLVSFVFTISPAAFCAEAETRAVAYCIASGAVEPEAFAFCVGEALTTEEIKKCLTGGDCFGKNNELRKALESLGINFDDIQKYGACGGPNSEVRKIFGSGVCGCAGPKGWVYIENRTSQLLPFNLEGSCTDDETFEVGPRQTTRISGEGDKWFNITVRSTGGTVEYGLENGMRYALYWRGNLLDVINVTPRYNP